MTSRIIPVKFRHIGANRKSVRIGLDIENEDLNIDDFAEIFRGTQVTADLVKPEDTEKLPEMREPEVRATGVFESAGANMPADKLAASLSTHASEGILMDLFRLCGAKGHIEVHKVDRLQGDGEHNGSDHEEEPRSNAPATVPDAPPAKRPRGRPRKNPQPPEAGVQTAAQVTGPRPASPAPTPAPAVVDPPKVEPIEGDPAKLATPITSLTEIPEGILMHLVDANMDTVEKVARWLRSGIQLKSVGEKGRAKVSAAINEFLNGKPATAAATEVAWGCGQCAHRWPKGTSKTCPKCSGAMVYEVGFHGDPHADEGGDLVLGTETVKIAEHEDSKFFVLVSKAVDGSFRFGFEIQEENNPISAVYPNVKQAAIRSRSEALSAGAGAMLDEVKSWQGDPAFLTWLGQQAERLGLPANVAAS